MASPTVKSTYSLDVETVRTLERMARRWRVSKSEALRRAIRAAADRAAEPGSDGVVALDQLQHSLALDLETAGRWEGEIRRERRASTARRLPSGP